MASREEELSGWEVAEECSEVCLPDTCKKLLFSLSEYGRELNHNISKRSLTSAFTQEDKEMQSLRHTSWSVASEMSVAQI